MRTVPRRPVKSIGAAALLALAIIWLGLVVAAPLATVFAEAFAKGVDAARDSLASAETRSAIGLTFLVAGVSVPTERSAVRVLSSARPANRSGACSAMRVATIPPWLNPSSAMRSGSIG